MPGQMRSTIEKKIRSDAPLPTPRSVICSPSHITNIAPVVRKSAIWRRNAEARMRHGALQRLREQRKAPRLQHRDRDREVARVLRDLVSPLFLALHLLERRNHRRR